MSQLSTIVRMRKEKNEVEKYSEIRNIMKKIRKIGIYTNQDKENIEKFLKNNCMPTNQRKVIISLLEIMNKYDNKISDNKDILQLSFLYKKLKGRTTRVRNICPITGNTRGYYGLFGLSRHALKDLLSKKQIPCVQMASW